ncbi:MAG: hypothetical protein H8E76_11410 [Helicobacteraceae bacterium]|nr:hypothetical protein [Candidatus Sulfurimonas ponti]MBL6973745.1 hypothetical protein [Sulfurimonas sp.]
MKNATQIITTLQNKPQFSKLKKFKCIDKIKSMFMPSFTRFVKFAYFQNNTLFFVLNHNAGKQEFNNNVQNIKSALNFYTPQECQDSDIQDIKAFVTHSPTKKPEVKKVARQYYTERGSGEVEVHIHDERLNTLVRSIQNIIKAKNDT